MATQKILRFYFDAEFNDNAERNKLDPISVAFAPEDESKPNFYGVSNEYNTAKITPWLNDNVIKHLPPQDQRKSEAEIKQGIIDYLKKNFAGEPVKAVQIWAYNGNTDSVVLANLFGGLMNLRKTFNDLGFPEPEFREIKDLKRATGAPKLPAPENAHDCLQDALWNREFFKQLTSKLKKSRKFLIE